MKKVILPTALLLGLVGAAQAQVTLYGLLDGSYGLSVGDDAAGQRADFHSGGDSGSGEGNSTSRFGIKGSTDVGSGIKANFQLESNGITSDGSIPDPFFQRQAWLGFSGGFGEVRLGRQDAVAFQTAVGYDFNGASNGVSALYYANVAPWNSVSGRQSRSLQYISPDFAGVKFQLGYVPNGNGGTFTPAFPNATPPTEQVGSPTNKDTFSAAVTYAAGPFSVTGNYESERNGEAYGAHDFASVVGSYDAGVLKVMLGYADGGENAVGWSTGITVPLAGFNFGGLIGYNTDTKGAAYEVFVNKEVLKNTIVYAEAGHTDKKTLISGVPNEATGFAVGVIYIF